MDFWIGSALLGLSAYCNPPVNSVNILRLFKPDWWTELQICYTICIRVQKCNRMCVLKTNKIESSTFFYLGRKYNQQVTMHKLLYWMHHLPKKKNQPNKNYGAGHTHIMKHKTWQISSTYSFVHWGNFLSLLKKSNTWHITTHVKQLPSWRGMSK